MKLLFLISGRQVPSSRFRVLQYLPHLAAQGHTCHVAASCPPKYEHIPWLGWRASGALRKVLRVGDALRAASGNYDAVLLERELIHDASTWTERLLRRCARRLILDVDDAIFTEFPDKFAALAPRFDAVIAGNDALASRVRPLNPRTTTIPTCVDLTRYPARQQATATTPIIGWIGTSSNLKYLEIAAPALRRLAGERSFILEIVCDRPELVERLSLTGVQVISKRWSAATEIGDLLRFDVGLMPLADDEWTRFKCGLKAIQYLAIGIPAVVSPVGVNREIVSDDVTGFCASSDEEW